MKKTFDKRFAIPLDFDFFKHPVYLYGLKERLIVRLKLAWEGNCMHWGYSSNIQAFGYVARI